MERKTVVKITLLVVAFMASVGMILGFAYTKAVPPKQLVFKNQHDLFLQEYISAIENGPIDSLELRYRELEFLWSRITKEALIDVESSDKRLENIVAKYTPRFITRSELAFNNSEWDTPDWSHSFMTQRINELRQIEASGGNKIIESGSSFQMQFDSILSTINKYDEAWKLARKTNFESLSTTKNRVSMARSYKSDIWLNNCVSLVDALNALPGKIKDSHLRFLKKSVQDLKYYPSLSDYNSYLISLKALYNNRLDEYANYYSEPSKISILKNELKDHQMSVLKDYISWATSISNFYYYSDYKEANNNVYNYIGTFLGSTSKRDDLRNEHALKIKTEDEFKRAKDF